MKIEWSEPRELIIDNIDKVKKGTRGVYYLTHRNGDSYEQPFRVGQAIDINERLKDYLKIDQVTWKSEETRKCLLKHAKRGNRWFRIALLTDELVAQFGNNVDKALDELENVAEKSFGGKDNIECNIIAAPTPQESSPKDLFGSEVIKELFGK